MNDECEKLQNLEITEVVFVHYSVVDKVYRKDIFVYEANHLVIYLIFLFKV